ncbi:MULTISPECIES: hypothetical protein [Spirosoma]|uniref:Uncharacterized protein n=1 Tax=Spirosoma liriopis TaxID=2937440 RepID=A0ABT0HSM0_9BACT|nr:MULTISPECIES: hypothetical protein [Spirosoma]MCK8495183.1 hypothetical protein [Spirosoma liriopis]UHG94230.1 hypothetical protein LQ777_27045 [Spirosoma oryzicola]
MIRTSIILEVDGHWPIWHSSAGFAKNVEEANWLFSFCGWNNGSALYPRICYEQLRHDWVQPDPVICCKASEPRILGAYLCLN